MNVEKFVVGALSIFLASALVSVSAAQSNESGLTRFDKDTGIPDDVMLPKFVKMIAEYADDKPEIDGLKYGVRLIQTRLSLQSYEEAELLLNYFVQVDEEISRSKSQFFRDTVCPLDVPRPEGPSVFEKMNAANANIEGVPPFFKFHFCLSYQHVEEIAAVIERDLFVVCHADIFVRF